ncbi:MAG: hypothetical protein OXH68_12685 [Gammaproteobacteria bacterium]|nr:hypothetical protein [Gammaproteobacteria bacterium]
MIKSIGLLAAGVALGVVAVLLVQLVLYDDPAPAPHPLVTSPQAPVPAAADSSTPDAVSLAQIDEEAAYGFERNAALYDLLRSADIDRIEALLEEADAANLAWTTWPIHSRYVDLAPRAALNYLVSKYPDEASPVYTALFAWALEDLDAALAFAETLDQPQRSQAGRNLLYSLPNLSAARQEEIARRTSVETELTRMRAATEAASDPASAWRRALEMQAGEPRTQTLWAVAWRWFDQNPAAALSAVNSVADTSQRDSWQTRLLDRWIGTDPDAALQWTVSQPPSAKRTSLIAKVAAAAAKDSPAETLAVAETLDTKARREVARRVLAVWAKSDPRAALAALGEMDDRRLKQTTESSLVHDWAQSDPMAVFEWARTQPDSEGRTQALSTALRNVAQSDPVEALALAEVLDKDARSNAIDSVLRQWGRDDPRAAAAWLDASQHESDGAVAAIIGEYAQLDAKEAVDWLLAQPADAQRAGASAIVWSLIEESPEVALELVERLEDPTTAIMAGSQLISRWAEDDPRAAVRAIARIGDDARPSLYTSAFSTWSRHDPEGANAYIGQIPVSGHDWAIQGVMQQTLSDGDVESAENLFERIVDTEPRKSAATMMYFHFIQSDPARAERYREMSVMTVDEDGSLILRVPAQGF